jgi:hypothetical protein
VTTGTVGVDLTGASAIAIEDSLIANLENDAVHVFGTGRVKIGRSVLRNNKGFGLRAREGAACEMTYTRIIVPSGLVGGGVLASTATAATTTVTVSDSVISGPATGGTSEGVYALSQLAAGAISRISLSRSTIEGVAYALDAEDRRPGDSGRVPEPQPGHEQHLRLVPGRDRIAHPRARQQPRHRQHRGRRQHHADDSHVAPAG